jgi:hypothetical protein
MGEGGRKPTHDEIQAVVGSLAPVAAGKALAAHLQIDIQAAYDILDGYYSRRMWEAMSTPAPPAARSEEHSR